MCIVINKSILFGIIKGPPSKSYTHRSLLISSLARGISYIQSPLISEDTLATIKCCIQLGATFFFEEKYTQKIYNFNEFINTNIHNEKLISSKIPKKITEYNIIIFGFSGNPNINNHSFNVQNSGTTLRFLIGLSLIHSHAIYIDGDFSIKTRPNKLLIKILENFKYKLVYLNEKYKVPLVIIPPSIKKKKNYQFQINGHISSQYISSILLASPLLPACLKLRVNKPIVSKYYINMTLELLGMSKIKIFKLKEDKSKIIYFIKGKQEYKPINIIIPSDFSSISYILVAASLTKYSNIIICNMFASIQSDIKIINILNKMGASIIWNRING